MHILLLDNIDSFTYNLVDALRSAQHQVTVIRNNQPMFAVLDWLEREQPDLIVLSPGPGNPRDAGCMMELIHAVSGRWPILGICLGHQALALAAGGQVRRANQIRHGKASRLQLTQCHPLFLGLVGPVHVARYHSLVVDELPVCAEVLADCDGEIMAFAIPELRQLGLQFHPESILTTHGALILRNALDWLKPLAKEPALTLASSVRTSNAKELSYGL
ncbi:aminodeoxychorismate/anthranilate synthase component II [Cellvibrio sp. OA-2007]|uniref:aminodeoxychorismate/anthranilate synthase component II n=1 Tax=Cellvibrio sp. OA-2007 TaxID=529823 RepID=UPI000A044499|nr:aminodeoxychorismate/anthranilate synthase component II [Cellvibrio sp. OA-2007]